MLMARERSERREMQLSSTVCTYIETEREREKEGEDISALN